MVTALFSLHAKISYSIATAFFFTTTPSTIFLSNWALKLKYLKQKQRITLAIQTQNNFLVNYYYSTEISAAYQTPEIQAKATEVTDQHTATEPNKKFKGEAQINEGDKHYLP